MKRILIMTCTSLMAMLLTINKGSLMLSSSFLIKSDETTMTSKDLNESNNIIKYPEKEVLNPAPATSNKSIHEIVCEEVKGTHLDADLILAIIKVESNNNPNEISYDSYGADYGLMQIRNINHEEINKHFNRKLNYLDARDNIKAGIYLLNKIYDKYIKDGLNCVLMVYNMGEIGAKQLWQRGIYSTRYSEKVLKYYN